MIRRTSLSLWLRAQNIVLPWRSQIQYFHWHPPFSLYIVISEVQSHLAHPITIRSFSYMIVTNGKYRKSVSVCFCFWALRQSYQYKHSNAGFGLTWWLSQMSPIVARHCSLNLSLEINSQFATFFQSLRRCVSFDSRQCTCSRQRSVETKKIETTSFCIEEDPLALDFGIWLSEVFEEFFSFPTWAGAIHTTFLHYSPCNCNAFVCRVPQTQDLGLFSLAY